jgi:hypothetical protein
MGVRMRRQRLTLKDDSVMRLRVVIIMIVVVVVADAGEAADVFVVRVATESRLNDHATVLELVLARNDKRLRVIVAISYQTFVRVTRLPRFWLHVLIT